MGTRQLIAEFSGRYGDKCRRIVSIHPVNVARLFATTSVRFNEAKHSYYIFEALTQRASNYLVHSNLTRHQVPEP